MNTNMGTATGSGFGWEVIMETMYTRASYTGASKVVMGFNGYESCSGAYSSIDNVGPIASTSMTHFKIWSGSLKSAKSSVIGETSGLAWAELYNGGI